MCLATTARSVPSSRSADDCSELEANGYDEEANVGSPPTWICACEHLVSHALLTDAPVLLLIKRVDLFPQLVETLWSVGKLHHDQHGPFVADPSQDLPDELAAARNDRVPGFAEWTIHLTTYFIGVGTRV